tara:strand:- start:1293 stop:1880 length:588 start_codon:yes stop_codon:yes gene_type:complete
MKELSPFIGCTYMEDKSICDDIIDFFNDSEYANKYKYTGTVLAGVKKHVKDSTDLTMTFDDPVNEAVTKWEQHLGVATQEYVELYPNCNKPGRWTSYKRYNIQHYKPNGGYHGWHCERSNPDYPTCNRYLTFMTYLNDVDDGGGTEFSDQKFTIKAEKGKTIIWPVDWTFTHRGEVSHTEHKYIITGWYNFIDIE